MEFTHNAGIVLKLFPTKHKIAVLDREHGIIEAVADPFLKTKRLCNGAYIVYTAQGQGRIYFLGNLDFIHVPFDWARQDILFLHHVLELVYYFLPPKSPHPDIFNLVRTLYASDTRGNRLFKKNFLIQFFLALGMYPEDEFLLQKMHNFIENPVDDQGGERIHLDEPYIDAWLISCIRMHPYNELFKTIHFLTQGTGTHDET